MRPSATGSGLRGIIVIAFCGVIALLPVILPAWSTSTDLRLISVATGSRAGVYYYTGGAICDLVDDHRWQHGLRCVTEKTAGSIANLRALRSGEASFAIVQSDWLDSAYRGAGIFAGSGPDPDLRTVFAIYPEPFTVIAAADSGITRFSDLLGKRVNVGPLGSGSRATMRVVMEAMGWEEDAFSHLSELDGAALSRAICDGEVDAAVLIIAHPNLSVEEMITSCDAALVPVEAPGIERLIAEHPYYLAYAIPGGTYPGQPATVPVFALAATLVTRAGTAPSVVYEVVRDVFGSFEDFRARHPAFAEFGVDQMLSEGLTAPLHSGALKFYQEADFWRSPSP